jgi:hypothetical protein
MEWKRLNGVIIGCEDKGIEYNLIAICKNPLMHQLYHDQLKKDKESEQDEYVS